jgi:DNA (cytosine-5)-methyltransferase 1
MGLPAGFVTDLELPYGAQLKALGNGVVPQQATAGLQRLVDQVPRTGDHISPNDERSNN